MCECLEEQASARENTKTKKEIVDVCLPHGRVCICQENRGLLAPANCCAVQALSGSGEVCFVDDVLC